MPANNLILTVESPANIAYYEIFSTENRTIMVEEENHTLVAKFPRFVHGDGSLIKIEIFSAEHEPHAFNQNYIVYATYDEGSLKIASQIQQATSSTPYGLTIALTIAALLTFAIPYFYRRAKRNRQRRHNMLVSYTAENISYVKKYCETDSSSFESSPRRLINLVVSFNIHEYTAKMIIQIASSFNDVKGIFKNERDFYVVSDFYQESARRILESEQEFEGEGYPAGKAIQKNRKEIAEIAKKTVGEIRWQEYDVNMTNVLRTVSERDYDFVSPALSLTRFRRYNVVIDVLQPMLAILVIPFVLSIGSYLISGDPLEWVQRFETYHWLLFAAAVFLGIIIFLSRRFLDLVSKLAKSVTVSVELGTFPFKT